MFDQNTLFMVFLMLCFAGIAAMFYFVMRSLDEVAREIKGERSQIVGALQSMESSLDILVKAAQVALQRQNAQAQGAAQGAGQNMGQAQGAAAFAGRQNIQDNLEASSSAAFGGVGGQMSSASSYQQMQATSSSMGASGVSGTAGALGTPVGGNADELPSLSLRKQAGTRATNGAGLSIKMD